MIMNNKYYDVLKWVVQVVMPSLAVFIGTVGISVGWEQPDLTITILTAVTAFLGSVLGVSNHNYKKDETAE